MDATTTMLPVLFLLLRTLVVLTSDLVCNIRPCVGKLGSEPIEGDMFDMDGHGHVQVSLLPQETLYIPFTFLTLVPYTPIERKKTKLTLARRSVSNPESKDDTRPLVNNKEYDAPMEEVQPTRSIEVKFISGTHGHVVANLVVEVCPLPCVVDRVFRFFEPENSVMKRRIRLVGCDDVKMFPGEAVMSSKYVHCVENGAQPDCRVVVEWGPSGAGAASERAAQESGIDVAPAGLDILLRYRCSGFPGAGDFYILLFNDPYQSSLHEVPINYINYCYFTSNIVDVDLARRGTKSSTPRCQ